MAPKWVALQSWTKIHETEKKNFLEEKVSSSLLFVQIRSSKRCVGIFQSKWVWRYLAFQKIVLCNKIINKTGTTENQENSAHHSRESYLTNQLAKFLKNAINDTHIKERVLYWIQHKTLWKYKVGCFWRFSYIDTIN